MPCPAPEADVIAQSRGAGARYTNVVESDIVGSEQVSRGERDLIAGFRADRIESAPRTVSAHEESLPDALVDAGDEIVRDLGKLQTAVEFGDERIHACTPSQ